MSDAGIDDQQRVSLTREVTITLRMPLSIADKVERLHAAEPEFLEHVVQYAITRRAVCHGILELNLADKSRTTEEV
ncbi:MAG: hypothetical protein QGD93_02715 [Actinomycetota bacterium]|nr:hypothetical protein [Actinomycetota bacterium]